MRGRAGLAGSSGSGSDGTTAVRAGSAGFARASAAAGGGVETVAGPGRRTTGSTSGSRRAGAVFSTILMRESALFWGRNAFDSLSRTINCLGAWVFPCRMASTVDSSSAACGDLTSTPIDWSRKRTSLLPIPICSASSSTRIFPIELIYS